MIRSLSGKIGHQNHSLLKIVNKLDTITEALYLESMCTIQEHMVKSNKT